MALLFIGSTGDSAGHTLLIWAVGRRLLEKGVDLAFVKPFGTIPFEVQGLSTDYDAYFFKEVFALDEPYELICPFLPQQNACAGMSPREIVEALKSLIQELSVKKDAVLVMGSSHIFFDDPDCPIPDVSLIPELGAQVLLVTRHRNVSKSIYSILSVSSLLRESMKGIILNRVSPEEISTLKDQVIPLLLGKGVPTLTALPEDSLLYFRSLREVCELLEAEILWGKDSLGIPVGGMTVGSADLTTDLLPFKRAYNKIILLQPGKARVEDQGVQTQRAIAGIILTRGRMPPSPLLQAARKVKVPLILIKGDTFAALERLEQSPPRLSPKDEDKIRHFTQLLDKDDALNQYLRQLGLLPL